MHERQGSGSDGLVGKVLELAELVDYQPEAIVSRALVDKPSGTVTLFAFGEGEGLSEHTAPYDALVVVLDGELEITIGGAPHVVRRGQMLIMQAHQPHALRARTRAKMLLVMVR